jgi:hypothetical protein
MAGFASRRGFLAGMVALCVGGRKTVSAASGETAELDDPFLGQTTTGDLILAPSKTLAAATPPTEPQFFGIVRKTDTLKADQEGAGEVKMLVLYAAFRDGRCGLFLCGMQSLAGRKEPAARRAFEALAQVAQRLKDRPDAVYEIQDVDHLPAGSCNSVAEA